MNPWWSEAVGTYVGAYGGAGIGIVCGTFGALAGTLARRGKGRAWVLGFQIVLTVLAVLTLIAGVVAVFRGQPYHVYFPLLLLGGITGAVMGPLVPVMRRQYEEAEHRRMEAEEIRRQA